MVKAAFTSLRHSLADGAGDRRRRKAAGICEGIGVMSLSKAFVVAVVLMGQALPAMAADMPGSYAPRQPLPIPERLQFRTVSANSGWYLRGDLGYAMGRVGSAESPSGTPNPTDRSLGNGMTGGLGAGIKSTWLRTDVTVDYTSALKYQGTIAAPGDVNAKISAWSVLFNGYIDLGTWYRATPYIGGGVGTALVRTSDYSNVVAPPATAGSSSQQWNFAWAALAGVGYAIAPNMMVDVGYRYINFGDGKTADDTSGRTIFKNLAAHEVRVGLRWSFDDLPVQR
jgi:opacity protein-like surface antigen